MDYMTQYMVKLSVLASLSMQTIVNANDCPPPPIFVDFDTFDTLGDGPRFMVSGDLDGNARPDVVIRNSYTEDLCVMLNDGDGRFSTGYTLAPSFDPVTLTLADLDGDNDLDMVVSYGDIDQIGVFLNNGDATFQPEQAYPTRNGPGTPMVADFNSDGHPDIAVLGFVGSAIGPENNSLCLFLNNGSGTFSVETPFDMPAVLESASGDVNGDGLADIVINYDVFDNGGKFMIALSNGDGTFAFTYHESDHERRARRIKLGDIDNDGDNDLLAILPGLFGITIDRNNGNGQFGPTETYPFVAHPHAFDLRDFDGDGDMDLAAGFNPNGIRTYTNDGAGNFTPDGFFQAFPYTNNYQIGVALEDLDGDQDIDVVAANSRDSITVIRNQSEAPPLPCPADFDCTYTVDFSDASTFLTLYVSNDPAADIDGSGVLDFADVSAFLALFAQGCP